jgi:hypothetical protein
MVAEGKEQVHDIVAEPGKTRAIRPKYASMRRATPDSR